MRPFEVTTQLILGTAATSFAALGIIVLASTRAPAPIEHAPESVTVQHVLPPPPPPPVVHVEPIRPLAPPAK